LKGLKIFRNKMVFNVLLEVSTIQKYWNNYSAS
jgi:hypothetical protein